MAADVGKVYPTEVHLLKQEIAVQGDLLNQERLERKAEVDQLRLQLTTLKQLIERIHPGFMKDYDELYAQLRLNWNPELEKPEQEKKGA